MTTKKEYWNAIFSKNPDSELGWHEDDISQTLKFLDQIPQDEIATVFLPGAGTSLLVDELVNRGHQLILNDISDDALNKLKSRVGTNSKLSWLHHDISRPLSKEALSADIWIDRAVLHFLLDEADIRGYFENLRSVLKPGGYALMAEFSTRGARKCAGLELHRYSIEEMTRRMGPGFELLESEEYTYTNPAGEPRPYIYALYKRHDAC